MRVQCSGEAVESYQIAVAYFCKRAPTQTLGCNVNRRWDRP